VPSCPSCPSCCAWCGSRRGTAPAGDQVGQQGRQCRPPASVRAAGRPVPWTIAVNYDANPAPPSGVARLMLINHVIGTRVP
jgi:hypothetical protein